MEVTTTTKPRNIDVAYIMVRDVFKNWLLILCVALSAMFISYIFASMSYVPQYTSRCTMIVSAKVNNSGAYTNTSETKKLTNTIKAVMNSKVIKRKTAESLGMGGFPGSVSINVVPKTNLIEVSVKANNPSTAFKLLKGLLETYPEVSKDVLGEIVMEVFEEPNFPTSPSNGFQFRKTMNLSFWGAGLFVVIISAVYYYLMDTVKNEWDADDKLDTKLLGVLYHESTYKNFKAKLKKKKKRLLMGAPAVSFGFSETVKKIRTNLSYFQDKVGGNVLLVTSYDKKEGKTTVTANLAYAIAQRHQSVLVIPGAGTAKDLLALLNIKTDESFQEKTKESFDDIIVEKNNSSLCVMAITEGDKDKFNFSNPAIAASFKEFIDRAKEEYDYVIIDGPCAKDSGDTEYLARLCDFSLLVVKQNATKVALINDTIDILNRYNKGLSGCVFNDAYSSTSVINIGYGYGYGYRRYIGYGYAGYGRYGGYGKYGSYGKYGGYGAYGAYLKPEKDTRKEKQDKKSNKYGSYYQHSRYESKRDK